jgi:hypothetical protein
MKKFLAVGAVCAVAFGTASTAQGGVEATDAAGNFIVLDADFNPSASSTRRTITPANLNIDISFGNKRTGNPFPSTAAFDLALPRGTAFNGAEFPQCPLPATSAETGADRCSNDAKVGTGGAVIDARALGVQEPVVATMTVFNGAPNGTKPTLILLAKATVNGQPLSAEINLEWTRGRFALFNPTPDTPLGLAYSFSSVNLDIGATLKTRLRGRRVSIPLFYTPRTCPRRGWVFSFNHADANGGRIAAPDRQPCVQLRD